VNGEIMMNIEDILTIKTNNVKPDPGKILISEPFLLDYYFKRSVILLVDHNEEGSFGVIMNKPLSINLNEVINDFPEFEASIYLGGPVENDSIFFLHTLGDQIEGSIEVVEGLYWGGDMEIVKEMIALKTITTDQIRFYVGYSGWTSNQLDEELERNSWVVSNESSKYLLNTNADKMWAKSLHKLGGSYAFWPNFPNDPGQN
jgi:putative transcriptional regulator